MSPFSRPKVTPLLHFPRVSGDEPRLLEVTEKNTIFSPRERG